MTEIPAHVPKTAVVDFDYFAQPGMREDPYKLFGDMFNGRDPRIVWTTANGGHWIIGGYDELFDAWRKTEVFSSTSMQIPEMPDEPRFFPLNSDPPEHAIYRQVLSPSFAPGRMVKMEQSIRDFTDTLIAKVKDAGRAEFVHDVAEPLPVTILMTLAGVPKHLFRSFRDNVVMFLTDPPRRTETLEFFHRELHELMEAKRKEPKDDIISQIVASEINGRPITEDELMGFVFLLMLAGLDTVTNAMSLGIRHLAMDHELQEKLRSDHSLIPLAVEELLRRYSFALEGRLVVADADFHGMHMKKGDRVLFAPSGAGIDPGVYPDPERVDIFRKGKGIPTFGFGPHRCVGMHLARLELRVLYEQWLSQIPTFSLDPAKTPTFIGGVVIGLEHLDLVW